jgi:hypothetical protein
MLQLLTCRYLWNGWIAAQPVAAAGIISVSEHVDQSEPRGRRYSRFGAPNLCGRSNDHSARPGRYIGQLQRSHCFVPDLNSLEREIEVRAGNILGQANHLMECGVLPQQTVSKRMGPTLEILSLYVLRISAHIRSNEYVCRLATRRRGQGAGFPTVDSRG